jgi:hypothetical protein
MDGVIATSESLKSSLPQENVLRQSRYYLGVDQAFNCVRCGLSSKNVAATKKSEAF